MYPQISFFRLNTFSNISETKCLVSFISQERRKIAQHPFTHCIPAISINISNMQVKLNFCFSHFQKQFLQFLFLFFFSILILSMLFFFSLILLTQRWNKSVQQERIKARKGIYEQKKMTEMECEESERHNNKAIANEHLTRSFA